MAGSNVGLVLRAQSVEVVEARQTLGGAVMAKAVRVPIDGPEDSQVVSAIQAALRTAQIKSVPIGVTIPAQDVFLRSFVLPHLPRSEWATAVQFEARKYIPFKLEELVWDFHAIEQRDTKQVHVIFAGMRTETFARVQGWLKQAGVQPAWIEAPGVSLARLAERPKKGSAHDCTVVVEVDADTAHVVITRGQIPLLARDVHLAGAPEGAGGGEAAPDPRVEQLISELRLSVDFFLREDPSVVIKQVLLFGDPALLALWRNELSARLRYPVEMGTLPLTVKLGESTDLGFALAASVACRSLRVSPARLDLADRSASRAASKAQALDVAALLHQVNIDLIRAMQKPAKLQAVLALAVLAGLAALSHQQASAVRRQVAGSLQAAPAVGWGLNQLTHAQLEALQPQVGRYRAFLQKAIRGRLSVTKKLEALAKVTPEGMWFESVSYHGSLNTDGTSQLQLALRGACFRPKSGHDLETIHEFVQRIKQDTELFQGFTASQLGQVTQQEDKTRQVTYRTFTLTCQSERGVL